MSIKKDFLYGGIYVVATLVASIIISITAGSPLLGSFRAFLGFPYVIFLPGYVLVRCFFTELDAIEKAALSFGLSIALVILAVMVSNLLLKIPITALTNFLVILAVILITLLVKWQQPNLMKFFRKS